MFSDTEQTRDSFRLAAPVSPGSTVNLTKRMQEAATVEGVRVRFYSGPRLDVRAEPYVEVSHGPDRTDRVNLIDYADEANDPDADVAAKDFIDGDDDDFQFDVSQPVDRDEVVGVEIENVNAEFTYNVTVDVVVDYAGGSSRMGGLLNRLTEGL